LRYFYIVINDKLVSTDAAPVVISEILKDAERPMESAVLYFDKTGGYMDSIAELEESGFLKPFSGRFVLGMIDRMTAVNRIDSCRLKVDVSREKELLVIRKDEAV